MNYKKSIFIIVFALLAYSPAWAVGFSGFVTADNHLWIWGYDGSGTWSDSFGWYDIPESDYHGWTQPKYVWGETAQGAWLDVYIAAADKDGPGGTMADFRTGSGVFSETGTDTLLSGISNWEVINYLPGWEYTGPTFDPNTLSGWTSPTSYGTNVSNAYWMWHSPLPYIDSSAEWIWTDKAYADNYVLFHARITPSGEVVPPPQDYLPPQGYTHNPSDFGQYSPEPGGGGGSDSVVPESATLSLFGLGLLGLGIRRKR